MYPPPPPLQGSAAISTKPVSNAANRSSMSKRTLPDVVRVSIGRSLGFSVTRAP